MPISVNGVEITDREVEQELAHHQESLNPLKAATEALVLRQVLRDAAHEAGMDSAGPATEDAMIEHLLAQSVKIPTPTEAECRRYYEQHPARFRSGDLVEARHILFQVTDQVPLGSLKAKAEAILAQVLADPSQFAHCARDYSNCPSGELGGQLGQLSRGQTVPEFERVLFALAENETTAHLVETRFGLHIVRVERKVEGTAIPFDLVKDSISRFLMDYAENKATRQFLDRLVSQANVQGIDLQTTSGPLLQ